MENCKDEDDEEDLTCWLVVVRQRVWGGGRRGTSVCVHEIECVVPWVGG